MIDKPETDQPNGNNNQGPSEAHEHRATKQNDGEPSYEFPKNARVFLEKIANPILAISTILLAIIAACALRDAKDTTIVSQRAYVYVFPETVYNLGSTNKLEARFVVSNSGKSFAKNVVRYAQIKISEPLRLDEIANLGNGELEPGIMTLGPDPRASIEMNRRMPNEVGDADDVTAGRKRIYVFGRVDYKDIWGNLLSTNFCFMYYGEKLPDSPTNASYLGRQAKYCNGHNDAD